MKTLPALTAAIVFGLGGICNETRTKDTDIVGQDPTIKNLTRLALIATEQEQNNIQSSLRYLSDLKDEVAKINQLNNNKKLSAQNQFFLMLYNQKIAELETLLNKYTVSQKNNISNSSLLNLYITIQIKIEEIELLKNQAHYNIQDTYIIGL